MQSQSGYQTPREMKVELERALLMTVTPEGFLSGMNHVSMAAPPPGDKSRLASTLRGGHVENEASLASRKILIPSQGYSSPSWQSAGSSVSCPEEQKWTMMGCSHKASLSTSGHPVLDKLGS